MQFFFDFEGVMGGDYLTERTARETVAQAITDFNSIRTAIINQNVNVPYATKTSEYSELIEKICSRFITGMQELSVRPFDIDFIYGNMELLLPYRFVETITGHDVLV